jgi:hypothetical protein
MDGPDDIVRVRAEGSDQAALLRALDEFEIDTGCTRVRKDSDGRFEIEGFATRRTAEALLVSLAARREVAATATIVENVSASFPERLRRVGSGSRFVDRSDLPRGLGVKE